jgi:hypothetical protein
VGISESSPSSERRRDAAFHGPKQRQRAGRRPSLAIPTWQATIVAKTARESPDPCPGSVDGRLEPQTGQSLPRS